MSDTVFHINKSAMDIKDTPAYKPYSKVVIIVGNDDDGNQLVYEAGDDSALTMEITNPYGTQEMANSILQQLSGFQYKPYTATGAHLNPAAELGDGISLAGDIYSFISSTETTLSTIMSATVLAEDDGELDHEYPYETRESKEVSRRINGVTTQFTVELGKVESRISETYETIDSANKRETRIGQTIDGIVLEASQTYQTKQDAETQMGKLSETLTASFGITANQIKSTVAAAAVKYDTSNVSIDIYGYGEPASMGYAAKDYNGKIYLDQETGYYYTSNGTEWVKSGSPLKTITSELESSITQTAGMITSTVASAVSKYDLSKLPSGVGIEYYGYGEPTLSASGKKNKYYLDQASGYYYKSNGSTWAKSSNALPLITDTLSSTITQTASDIRAEVNGIYAPEWEIGVGPTYDTYFYNPGDIVKVTSGSTVVYYECIAENDADDDTKPGSGAYWEQFWEEVAAPTVQSMIDIGLDGITLGYQSSDNANSATITLNRNGIQMQAQTITMTNVVADSLVAKSDISSPIIYNSDRDVKLVMRDADIHGYGAGIDVKQISTVTWQGEEQEVESSLFSVQYMDFGRTNFYFGGSLAFYVKDADTINAYGTWDFSAATVIGLE